MPRLPRAGEQLIRDVRQVHPDVQYEIVGDADGLGTHRSVRFDTDSAPGLSAVLETIGDPRIASVDWEGSSLTVTFVADHRADFVQHYPVADVHAVLHSTPEADETGAVEPVQPQSKGKSASTSKRASAAKKR